MYAACRVNQMVLNYGVMLVSGCVGSAAPWDGLSCRPGSAAACLPSRSYKVIHYWLLTMLDQEACASGHVVNRIWSSPVTRLGKLSKRLRTPQGLRMLVSCLQGSAAERTLGSV